MTLGLSINGHRTRIATVLELRREIEPFAGAAFREFWLDVGNGPALCALLNGGVGWLMHLRRTGDAGLSSRNPDYPGKTDAMIEYRLSNGQHDMYPASWALPESRVIQALEYFVECRQLAPFIQWHDDST